MTKINFLKKEKILDLNLKGKVGTYYLGEILNNKFQVLYVGRSDSCLQNRLLQHANIGEYTFFKVRVCRNKKEAYNKECEGFYSYFGLKNKISPSKNGLKKKNYLIDLERIFKEVIANE